MRRWRFCHGLNDGKTSRWLGEWAVPGGRDLAFGISGLKRGGVEQVSLVYLQLVTGSMHTAGA